MRGLGLIFWSYRLWLFICCGQVGLLVCREPVPVTGWSLVQAVRVHCILFLVFLSKTVKHYLLLIVP